jgi:hypothetical protein
VPTIDKDALPTPALVAIQQLQVARHSAAGDLIFTNRPDPALRPRAWAFTWLDRHGAVLDAVRRHYDEHFAATFTVKLPRTGESVVVAWSSPPSFRWNNAVAASATGVLEEQLARE